MPGRKAKTNKVLLMLSLVLCLLCGGMFTQSSATPSPIREIQEADIIVAGNPGATGQLSTGDMQNTDSQTSEPVIAETPDAPETPTPEAEPTKAPVVAEAPVTREPSPEASSGQWIPSGSSWLFMVNGAAYTGWFTDTDGKQYYLGSDGIMKTGWLELDGNRYYLDLDGILQTGEVTIDQETYHFDKDGKLITGDVPEETAPAEPAPTEATPAPTEAPVAEGTPAPTEPEVTDTPEQPEATPTPEPTATPIPTPTPTPEPVIPEPDKTIAITFDDGPSDYTSQILDLLAESDSKATFFMQGSHIEHRQEIVSQMLESGNQLGNHAYTHFDLSLLNYTDSSAEVAGVDELLTSYIGVTTDVMRPPYGNMNSELEAKIRKPIILWSVDSQDDTLTDPQQIADTILAGASDGAIVLMHDTSEVCVNAFKLLVPALRQQGYKLVTVAELAEAHGIELVSGTTYTELKK